MGPDLSTLTSSFLQFGGEIFRKNVLAWDLRSIGIQVRTSVNQPQALAKLSTVGTPRPYSAADSTTDGPKFTDRVLTAYQSKWDFDFDPEQFRNTYLGMPTDKPFYEEALNQVAAEYLDHLIRSTIYGGVRNASGTTPAAVADGFGKIIADEITATNLTPITTGALTNTNTVAAVDAVVEGSDAWFRSRGGKVYCSWATFDKYRKDYRVRFGFQFDKGIEGRYKLDNLNVELVPHAMLGTSSRLIATMDNNLVVGTNAEQVEVAASMRRNIVEVRAMMPIGMQIQDLGAIWVNDQA
jgi:hypothetical protein